MSMGITKDTTVNCTKDDPWTPDKGTPVHHHGAHEFGEQRDGWPGGNIVSMECPNCGHTWTEELPQ
jgi:hypothetical protein